MEKLAIQRAKVINGYFRSGVLTARETVADNLGTRASVSGDNTLVYGAVFDLAAAKRFNNNLYGETLYGNANAALSVMLERFTDPVRESLCRSFESRGSNERVPLRKDQKNLLQERVSSCFLVVNRNYQLARSERSGFRIGYSVGFRSIPLEEITDFFIPMHIWTEYVQSGLADPDLIDLNRVHLVSSILRRSVFYFISLNMSSQPQLEVPDFEYYLRNMVDGGLTPLAHAARLPTAADL